MPTLEELTQAMLVLSGYYDNRYMTQRETSIIKVQLPDGLSRQIQGWGEQHLTTEMLYKGKPGDSDQYGLAGFDTHITVKWGIHTNDPTVALAAMNQTGVAPFDITLGKISIFDTSPDYDVVKIDVAGDGLAQLHEAIPKYLECEPDTYPTYQPHITIGYVSKGNSEQFVGLGDFEGNTVHVDRVMFTAGSGRDTMIPLSGISMDSYGE